jgi:hypothetical protein
MLPLVIRGGFLFEQPPPCLFQQGQTSPYALGRDTGLLQPTQLHQPIQRLGLLGIQPTRAGKVAKDGLNMREPG